VVDVIGIARLAEAADGLAPLDEATLMTLHHHPDRAQSWGDDRGFGLLIGDELSLVVAPEDRGAGLGTRLLTEQSLPDGPLSAWSHGDHPAAAALAASHGWDRERELWVMRVDADQLPPSGTAGTSAPDGITLRAYRTDRPEDAAELLRVNAAAFAHHPEQGGMDEANLTERMAEPWFDPDGLVMAWDGDRLAAFHWTKRHSETEGEVYVVGVDPADQGRGLGKLVTAAGLAHLRDGGSTGIHLYVEGDNTPAVRLYEGLGFRRTQTHVQYVRR
jgi:mycothiol synthase